ncbi:hypothetical protein Tco_0961843 [Tanacetum coccineum]
MLSVRTAFIQGVELLAMVGNIIHQTSVDNEGLFRTVIGTQTGLPFAFLHQHLHMNSLNELLHLVTLTPSFFFTCVYLFKVMFDVGFKCVVSCDLLTISLASPSRTTTADVMSVGDEGVRSMISLANERASAEAPRSCTSAASLVLLPEALVPRKLRLRFRSTLLCISGFLYGIPVGFTPMITLKRHV